MQNLKLTRRAMLQSGIVGTLSTSFFATKPGIWGQDIGTNETSTSHLPFEALVGIEVGPTGANDKDDIYLSRMTGKEILDFLRLARAEYLVLFLKDMEFAYYSSKVARKCPNLGDRDLLVECLNEAQPLKIPLIAYCQIQYDSSSWRLHPEWRMKSAQGEDLEPRLCFNSRYIEFIKEIADEIMALPINGFHFDMLDFGFGPPIGCWCETCQGLFEKAYGMEMPTSPSWDEKWEKMLTFRTDSNSRFCQELQKYVHSKRPEISVDFNYHGYPPFSWLPGELPVKHAENGDFVTAEGLPFVFGHTNPSILTLFMKGARSDQRVQGVTSRSVYDYHDFTVRPVTELKWEVMTYLAHGAQCTVVDKANYDGTLDRLVYERLGNVFEEARNKRVYFGYPPMQEVGLYYSSRSRDWFAREDTPRYFAAFLGAHRALMQAHIQMGVICDEGVSLEQLKRFPVVYVPNAAVLTVEEIERLKQYVEEGGRLLFTGLTGLCDRYGNLLPQSLLEHLVGARLTAVVTEHPDNYLRFHAEPTIEDGASLIEEIPLDWPMLVWGPVAAYKAEAAKGYGELMTAFRSKDNLWSRHMSPKEAIGPAILVNRVGKGMVVTVPAVIDAAFIQRYRMPEHRNLIRNVIRFLHPNPEVEIHAPASVEAVVTRDTKNNRVLVHLLAYTAPPTASADAFPEGREVLPPVMEESLTYRAKIRLDHKISNVAVYGKETEVTVQGPEIGILTSEVHEVVVVSCSN